MIKLGTMPVAAAERLKSQLTQQGIAIETAFNHSTCTTGCSPSLEVWAHEEDAPTIADFIREETRAKIRAEGGDPDLAEAVFDTNLAEATCPACATVFSTKSRECPECGLGFGGAE